MKLLLISLVLFIFGQILVWYQTNLQFISEYWYKHVYYLIPLNLIMGTCFIYASRYGYQYFGEIWPLRILGFVVGIIIFTILTHYHMHEQLTIKIIIQLILCAAILVVQVFYK